MGNIVKYESVRDKIVQLQERVAMLERLLNEKERTIKILMER